MDRNNSDETHSHSEDALAIYEKLGCQSNIAENTGRDGAPDGGRETDPTHVEELIGLLGVEVVLLPIPAGTKRPSLPGWQHTTVEHMHDQEYLENLEGGNIGVLLGAPSGGLCAIDIDDDAAVEPFLALNPHLRNTLITKGKRGAQIWVKISGAYPKSAKLKDDDGADCGEWRATGNQSVIHGVHPDGMQYRRLNDQQPMTVNFGEICWPDNLVLPWAKDDFDELVEEHGQPYYLPRNGALQINEYFFVARFNREHLVTWEPMESEFYEYNVVTGLWEGVTEDRLKLQFGIDLGRAAKELNLDQFHFKRKDALLTSFVKTLRGLVEKRDAFKKRSPVIHLANGMLDLAGNTPQLLSFRPEFNSRNMCPIALDPAATCPRFINELLRSALDEEDIDLLQRWCGSVLLGTNPAQRILLLMGTSGGGKSTLIEVIEKMIGERNVAQLRTSHLNKQFEFYKFLGKTMLTGKDVGADFLNKDGAEQLKALVGNDLLDAEKKHGNEHFQLRGDFNIAITCNSRLRIRLEGDTGAWQRRLMILEYTRPKPAERIANFADKLIAAEGPGILNWMIEGAIMFLEDVEEYGDFFMTPAQSARVETLLAESDSMRQFVRDAIVPHENDMVTVGELLQAYHSYCENMGWFPVTNGEFKSGITALMLEIHHVGKRHDIPRGLKSDLRGFKRVTILRGL